MIESPRRRDIPSDMEMSQNRILHYQVIKCRSRRMQRNDSGSKVHDWLAQVLTGSLVATRKGLFHSDSSRSAFNAHSLN
jgi:hypothetical protein